MITLSTPLVLPAPFSETLANATLVGAHLDYHNRQVELVYAFGNAGATFAASPNLPGINISIRWDTGAVYLRGQFAGWVSAGTLSAIQTVLANFALGAEGLTTGQTITLPNPDGSKSGNTQVATVFPGTIG